MKNVPVPVYCRPLVEKDPNRKVEASLCAVGSGSNSRVGFLSWMFITLMRVCACVCFQLWCAAGVDLTGWKVCTQDSVLNKALSSSGDPLNAEDDGPGKRSSQSSPEKKQVV